MSQALLASALLATFTRAPARAAPVGLLPLAGQPVELELLDGRRERARVLQVHLCFLVLRRGDGAVLEIPTASILRLRPVLGKQGRGRWLDSDPPLLPCADRWTRRQAATAGDRAPWHCRETRAPPRQHLRVEWLGIRMVSGVGYTKDFLFGDSSGWGNVLGGELVLFTLKWPHVYWELLRGGGGRLTGPYWGTAVGYNARLDDRGRHQLRVGAHFTFYYGWLPWSSGLQVLYVLRVHRWLAFEVGVQQYSFPFAVGVTLGVRL